MGRKKIKIRTIENDRQKTVTFTRRRGGLIKKAHELAVLCECKVVLLMFDSKDECHMYSSAENPDELIGKYYNKEFHSGESKKRKYSKHDDPFTPIQENFNDTTPVVNEYKITTNGEGSENIQVKQVKGPSSNTNVIGLNGQQCITFEPITTTADDFIQPTSSTIPFSNSCVSSATESSDDLSPDILQEQLGFAEGNSDSSQQPALSTTSFLNIPAVETCVSAGESLISNLGEPFCFKPNTYTMPNSGDLTDIVDLCGSATTSPGSESPPEMFHVYPQHRTDSSASCLVSEEYNTDVPTFSKEIHPASIGVTNSNQYSDQLGYFPNFDPNSLSLWGWPPEAKDASFSQMVSPLSFELPKE